jgi:Protein of unknown function (DUF5818)
MKRAHAWTLLAAALVAGLLALPPAASADTASKSGWITDEACGAKGASAEHKACAERCVERGGQLVLYVNSEKKLYKLDNQKLAREHLGHPVTVTGKLNGDSIAVDSIAKSKSK